MSDDTRAEIIAAIRGYADWLEAHPDVEAPTDADFHVFHQHDSGLTREESLAACRKFTDKYGAEKKSSGSSRWVIATLSPAGAPIKIEHTIFATAERTDAEEW